MSRVRIVDVAETAGVSRATVTNALKGTGRMTGRTREHVLSVAAALGYPLVGDSLRHAPSRTLALGVTTLGAESWNFAALPYYAQVIAGALASAHARGYGLTVLPAAPADRRWHALVADGVLLLDPHEDDPVERLVRAADLPLVFVGRPARPEPCDVWVDNDHDRVLRSVLDLLRSRGARRIALIAGPGTDYYARRNDEVYRAWCAERGSAPLVVPLDHPELGEALFADPGERVDAVYGIYESAGRLALDAALRQGLRVPDDVLVACMSEDLAYAETNPPVTTVSLSPRLLGGLAVEALVQLLESGSTGAVPQLPTHVTLRASTQGR
ncbi:LacI family DNA-binding transcriptional regulator [Streptacidiphilus jiangxiensis]|uniref:DNA-binding transcriptional regulator, LacI/PurR family n=1 Tax=Streptacidiphilus jiangxiensis TaxID=235985 RepID=A0A1H7NEN9_STRJI|nr:LacI family DNA-binding transcriptional regulator [Streptacidiphilus jiangxiensis]SEL21914.1 DNA-binding transcriptional regulator, LacI/PurR family [Streptacidiphilus jiangxiensis]